MIRTSMSALLISLIMSLTPTIAKGQQGKFPIRSNVQVVNDEQHPVPVQIINNTFTEIVNLRMRFFGRDLTTNRFYRSLADGTSAEEEFRVPPGNIFVVTDLNIRGHYYKDNRSFYLLVRPQQGWYQEGPTVPMVSSVSASIPEGHDSSVGHVSFITGFVVSEGCTLGIWGTITGEIYIHALITGYLMPLP
jgi:hypothetical protein